MLQEVKLRKKQLLTIPEAARHFRVTENTIRRWMDYGKLEAIHPEDCSRRMVHPDALTPAPEAHDVSPPSED
jgi:hypothetical protein